MEIIDWFPWSLVERYVLTSAGNVFYRGLGKAVEVEAACRPDCRVGARISQMMRSGGGFDGGRRLAWVKVVVRMILILFISTYAKGDEVTSKAARGQ